MLQGLREKSCNQPVLMSRILLKTWLQLSRRLLNNPRSLIVTILQELWSKNGTAVLGGKLAEYFERITRYGGYPHITPIFLSFPYIPKLTILCIFR